MRSGGPQCRSVPPSSSRGKNASRRTERPDRRAEEGGPVYSADATSGKVVVTDGPYAETKELLGGFAVVDVADDEEAKMWAGRLAQGCGWPQEVRRFGHQPQAE